MSSGGRDDSFTEELSQGIDAARGALKKPQATGTPMQKSKVGARETQAGRKALGEKPLTGQAGLKALGEPLIQGEAGLKRLGQPVDDDDDDDKKKGGSLFDAITSSTLG